MRPLHPLEGGRVKKLFFAGEATGAAMGHMFNTLDFAIRQSMPVAYPATYLLLLWRVISPVRASDPRGLHQTVNNLCNDNCLHSSQRGLVEAGEAKPSLNR